MHSSENTPPRSHITAAKATFRTHHFCTPVARLPQRLTIVAAMPNCRHAFAHRRRNLQPTRPSANPGQRQLLVKTGKNSLMPPTVNPLKSCLAAVGQAYRAGNAAEPACQPACKGLIEAIAGGLPPRARMPYRGHRRGTGAVCRAGQAAAGGFRVTGGKQRRGRGVDLTGRVAGTPARSTLRTPARPAA